MEAVSDVSAVLFVLLIALFEGNVGVVWYGMTEDCVDCNCWSRCIGTAIVDIS